MPRCCCAGAIRSSRMRRSSIRRAQTAEKQARQFGYNTDFVGFIPIDGSSDHGLLVVNHEYTNEELMFPGVGVQDVQGRRTSRKMTQELVDIEMAAHGGAVVEIRRVNGQWQVVQGLAIQPPHHGRDADGDHRSGGRPRPHEDLGRSERPQRAAA